MALILQTGLAPEKLALLTLVLGVACVLWIKYVASRFHPGLSRLLASLPTLVVLLCIPLLWDYR